MFVFLFRLCGCLEAFIQVFNSEKISKKNTARMNGRKKKSFKSIKYGLTLSVEQRTIN